MGRWVEDNTFGLLPASTIPDDLPRSTTLMVLLNALYYKCSWGFEFDPELNKGSFQLPDGSMVEAEFMNQTIYKSCGVIEAQYCGRHHHVRPAACASSSLTKASSPRSAENDGFWREFWTYRQMTCNRQLTILKSDVNGKWTCSIA